MEEYPNIQLQLRLANCRTFSHIPTKVLPKVTEAYTALIQNILQHPEDATTHAFLQIFPKAILRIPVAAHTKSSRIPKNRHKTNVDLIKDRLRRWEDSVNGRRELVQEVFCQPPFVHQQEGTSETRNIARCKRLIECGRLSAAMQTLKSPGVASMTNEVRQALLEKHPQSTQRTPLYGPQTKSPSITTDMVKQQILSFPKGTACGLDGLRAGHIKAMIRCPLLHISSSALRTLTAFVNLALQGDVPQSLAPFLASAPITPLAKPDGGIRPIAVGETWRRLISKCAVRHVTVQASQYLLPLQLGVGIRNGAVSMVHPVKALVEKLGGEPNYVMLKLDFQNAFNLIERSVMLQEVQKVCPEIAAWVNFCYSQDSWLFLGHNSPPIRSCQGVQQGDPLGPLLFSITIHGLIQTISEQVPELDLDCILMMGRWWDVVMQFYAPSRLSNVFLLNMDFA